MMKKNCLVAVALLSLALAGGCAKGGNGIVPPPPSIDVSITSPSNVNPNAIYPTQSMTLTATVSNSTNTAVSWSLGPATTCTGTPNPCGTLTPVAPAPTPATATYVAPQCSPQPAACLSGAQPTITATLVSDTSVTGTQALTLVDITTDVAPLKLSVGTTGGTGGAGLTQQFTAVAVPDYAPQTFTWTCTAGGSQNNCANFRQDSNVSGLAYYTADDSCGSNCVQISAASTLDPSGCSPNPKYCTIATASLVNSRVNGTYTFQSSGYDTNNNPIAVVGTFTAANGTISTGAEEVLTASGPSAIQITGGSYQPTPSDTNNSNNAGTLTLSPSGAYPYEYQVVLDGAGDIQMIESDGQGKGSGIAQKSSSSFTGTVAQTYAFGFTGVDSNGKRVGYAGLMGFNGQFSGTPPTGGLSGLIDVNDGGQSSNSVCSSAPPCTITGAYSQNGNGSWHLALTSPVKMGLDFFVASGTTNKSSPLTFYAISTDPVATNPVVSGTMVLQDSSQTYNIAAFKATSVSALTGTGPNGANTNVSLTLGTTDGNGNFAGQFDQNNAGAVLSGAQFPPTGSNNYTYAASGTSGRYTFNMLGNPTANPVQAPLPFVLYASGANRGFLLDQNSSSVMTGTMNPQGKIPCAGNICALSASELPGTYAAATTSSGSSGVSPTATNLLLASQGGSPPVYNVSGTQYPAGPTQPVNGAYTLLSSGAGTISLTTPLAQNYVIYAVDTSGCTKQSGPVCAIQDFLMIDEDKTKTNTNPSIIFAQQ